MGIQAHTETTYYLRCDICRRAIHPEQVRDAVHNCRVAEERAIRAGWIAMRSGAGGKGRAEYACPACAHAKPEGPSVAVGSQQAQT